MGGLKNENENENKRKHKNANRNPITKDKILDSGDEFKFQSDEEEALAEKYSQTLTIPQIEALIQIHRAIRNGVSSYDNLEEDLQNAIKEADQPLLEAIKTEYPDFELPIKIQQKTNENELKYDGTNRDPVLEGLSFSQLAILEEIGKEIEKGINSFNELGEVLKENVIKNLNWRLYKAIKAKFPNFVLPPNLAIQKVSNAKEVESATRDAWITKAKNGIPVEFIFWDVRTGNLVKHRAKINEDNIWVELDEEEFISGPNRNNFEIFKDPETQRYYVLNKKNNIIYELVDYIKEEGGTSHMDDFIRMMQPPFVEVKNTVKEFKLYYDEEKDKFELPKRNEIYVRNEIVDFLLNRFTFDIKIDEETAREELNRFLELATPKQLADFLADLGFPLINLINTQLGADAGRVYICSWGATRTGKTWIHKFAMKYLWGFDFTHGTLQGNAINRSDFRVSVILSSTNLPIFIDEATDLDDTTIATIKASTLSAVNFRGTTNQKTKLYPSTTTLILTAQNNIFSSRELSNELALERRFYTNYHSTQVDHNVELDTFIADTKTKGYAIYLLQKYTLTELKELYFKIKKKTNDLILTGLLFASKLLNLSVEQFNKIEVEMLGTSPLERIVYWIYHDYEKTEGNAMKDVEINNLFNTITLKEKDGFEYLAINTNYISYVNSTHHPLKNKLRDLGDLNQLTPFFSEDEIAKLPGGCIYHRKKVERFGEKVMASATIPYRYNDFKDADLTEKLRELYKNLVEGENTKTQDKDKSDSNNAESNNIQQNESKPDDDPKSIEEKPQEAQKQEQKETDADILKKIKENEEKIEKAIELFNEDKDGLILGHDFQFAPADLREALEHLRDSGIIYEIKLDVWKKRGE